MATDTITPQNDHLSHELRPACVMMDLGNLQAEFIFLFKIFATFLAIFCLPMQTMASTWVFLLDSSDGDKIYEDTSSEVSGGGVVTFWISTKSKEKSGQYYEKFKDQIRVNCKEKTMLLLYEIKYRINGTVLNTTSVGGDFTPVAPDTVGEEELKWACKGH